MCHASQSVLICAQLAPCHHHLCSWRTTSITEGSTAASPGFPGVRGLTCPISEALITLAHERPFDLIVGVSPYHSGCENVELITTTMLPCAAPASHFSPPSLLPPSSGGKGAGYSRNTQCECVRRCFVMHDLQKIYKKCFYGQFKSDPSGQLWSVLVPDHSS